MSGMFYLRYVDSGSITHRLDPRTKLCMVITYSCVALFTYRLVPMSILLLSAVLLAALSGVFPIWLKALVKLTPFLAIIVVLDVLFPRVSYGPAYFSADLWLFHPQVTFGGTLYGITMGMRLLTFVGMSLLFIMTTKYEDFVKGLRKLGVPQTFAFSLGLGLRSATYLSADFGNILDAQRSRGLELDKGIWKLIERLPSLFVPMTVCLLGRAKNVSEAMQSRAYGHGRPTVYKDVRFQRLDYLALLLILAGAPLLVFVTSFYNMV